MIYSPEPETLIPGTHRSGKDTQFCVNVPAGAVASLLVYDKRKPDAPAREIPLEEIPWHGTLRCARVSGLSPKTSRYRLMIDGKFLTDPSAHAVYGRERFGERDADCEELLCGLAEEDFDWQDDTAPLEIPFEDVIAYHLHVRGFTKAAGSGVRHRGTFLGLKEKTDYLKDLGVNQVILMPAYEFDEILLPDMRGIGAPPKIAGDEKALPYKINYWGYGDTKASWFAPKLAYCATADPVREFRTMVRGLHEAGIEVIMEISMPDPVDVNLLCRCLRWWHIGCHVDGFSLLMSDQAARAAAADPALGRAKIICESFTPDAAPGNGNGFRHIARKDGALRYRARRLLKGDGDQLGGFCEAVRTNYEEIGIYNCITGHEGMTLLDLVSYDRKHNEENGEQNRDGAPTEYSWNCGEEGPTRKRNIQALRLKQMKNAMAMLLLSQGTPVIRAGDERGNTQKGNSNPYCIDSAVTWVDWRANTQSKELYAFVKELIALRKANRILHMPRPLAGADSRSCGYPDFSCHGSRAWYGGFEYENRHIGFLYCGMYAGEESFIYTAYNMYWEPQDLALPLLPEGMRWETALDTAGVLASPEDKAKEIRLEPRSARVLTAVKVPVKNHDRKTKKSSGTKK